MSALTSILDGSLPRQCGVEHSFRLRRVEVGPRAFDMLADWVLIRGYRRVFVVSDLRTFAAAGRQTLAALAAGGAEVVLHGLVEVPGQDPSADEAEVERARVAAADAQVDVLVSVGSGTVTDVAKMAATALSLPWLAVPTAPSMNGYTSAIAAILVRGVKRTIACQQTEAVFAHDAVLAAAPERLVAAGFADLSSKPFSHACWILSAELTGATYSPTASEFLDASYRELMASAELVGRRTSEGMTALMNTLVLSGCSMALAGSSSPASGGEHLLSHYWDMVEHAHHRPVRALHGLQVGVATVVTGRLYESLLAMDIERRAREPSFVNACVAAIPPTHEDREAQVRSRHPELPPAVVGELVEQSLAKHVGGTALAERIRHLGGRWGDISMRLRRALMPSLDIVRALSLARAPIHAAQLGVSAATLAHTTLVCRDMRSRYTVLDLAAELGVLPVYAHFLAGAGNASPPATPEVTS